MLTSRFPLFLASIFGLLTLLFLWLWVSLSLIWSIENSVRNYENKQVDINQYIVLDYPKVLSIDDNPQAFSIAVPAVILSNSFSIALKIPSEVVVTSVEPMHSMIESTITDKGTNLIISFPLTATQNYISPYIHIPTLLIDNKIYKSTVYIKNAKFKKGVLYRLPFESVFLSDIEISLLGKQIAKVPIELETVVHSESRKFFANLGKDSALATFIPMLAGVIGWMYLKYQENQKSEDALKEKKEKEQKHENELKERDAIIFLSEFKLAVIEQNIQKAKDITSKLRLSIGKFIDRNDWEYVQSILQVMNYEIPSDITINTLSIWTEVWASAFIYAGNNKNLSNNSIYLQYIRMFPRHILSQETEYKFKQLQTILKLESSQARDWPSSISNPPLSMFTLETNIGKRLKSKNILPFHDAALTPEQLLLFAPKTGWYWTKHPIYEQAEQSLAHNASLIIYGSDGSGKTALGLALGRYLHNEYTFGCYLRGVPTVPNIQLALSRDLLYFVQKHLTWLIYFDLACRDLLAKVWTTVLDKQFILAQLDIASTINPRNELAKSTEPNAEREQAWLSHELAEAQLIQDSIRKADTRSKLSIEQWFNAWEYCVHKLGFRHSRLVLDVDKKNWNSWFESTPKIISQLDSDGRLSVSTTILVPELPTEELLRNAPGFSLVELNWMPVNQIDPLIEMLKYRCMRCELMPEMLWDVLPLDSFISYAHNNPRRLARLWEYVTQRYPNTDSFTEAMIKDASEHIP